MKKRGLRRYYRNLSKVTFAEEIIVELKSGTAKSNNTLMPCLISLKPSDITR